MTAFETTVNQVGRLPRKKCPRNLRYKLNSNKKASQTLKSVHSLYIYNKSFVRVQILNGGNDADSMCGEFHHVHTDLKLQYSRQPYFESCIGNCHLARQSFTMELNELMKSSLLLKRWSLINS